mgnify:CR=1 FL=1
MKENIKVQGYVLLDVDVVALNNAGKDTMSNFDNAVKTKSIYKNGLNFVYVSGQAWRFWWREALQKNVGWTLSPVIRDKNIAFTTADPLTYPDDDIFGYMRAATEEYEEKGKKKIRNITVTRVSPLKNSALISVASVRPVSNWSSMARQNRSGYKNISETLKEKAIKEGASEIIDPFGTGKLVRLPLAVRQKRIVDTVLSLKNISGGAMQTNNMGDVTPKFIVLASMNTGNHPFSHIAISRGDRDERALLNITGLREVLNEYKENFIGKVFIGRRSGFFDDYDKELKELADDYKDRIEYLPVNAAIDKFSEQLKFQIR